ncbi:STAS domain-containing protein [Baekduia sp. Peel2402]|uniref:STAS domain-containing protein n=1 Tax=Baekduia sp. Peel2402 TaxID=3458296 RepID=UPI00403E9B9D
MNRAAGLPDDTFWIVVDDESGVPCVRLSGDLDLAATSRLRTVLRPLIASHQAQRVTVDLDAVDLVETVSASFLAREQLRAHAQGVGLELRGARGVARRLLALAGARQNA